MHILEKISEFVGKWMAIVVLVIAALSLFVPKSTLWIELSWVNYLLMVVMFGMGLTLKLNDFKLVFTRPKEITIGCAVLVGTCPGGTSSNVITYLSKGDVALSVGMTSVNTLLAPILTPAITYLLLRTTVNVDVMAMFLSIVKVVIVPIALGFIINKFFGKWTSRAVKVLPLVSVIAIAMIVAAVVSHNAAKILSTGAIVFAVVILHNLLGYGCGFGLGKLLKFSTPKTKALSIEIGMQNSGLATSLASTAFSSLAMATVPGAIFSVWHNISGAILANVYRRWEK